MPLINITVPVLNEAGQLAASIGTLHRFLSEHCRFEFEIVVADNGSTDGTLSIARDLAGKCPSVRVLRLEEKGRGRALKRAWRESRAEICSYMDVDLSTDLHAFPSLVESLIGGGFDLAIGSRLLKPALTTRGIKRELISRCYNLLVKAAFRTRFSDAQCGFKAITRPAAQTLLPLVEDNGWFLDTELLVLAEKLGYRIFDLPVQWNDDPDSRVKIARTAWEDLKGIVRVRRNLWRGEYAGAGKEKNS
jgi:glycosyltransferase involved in cell wall biosynthesis